MAKTTRTTKAGQKSIAPPAKRAAPSSSKKNGKQPVSPEVEPELPLAKIPRHELELVDEEARAWYKKFRPKPYIPEKAIKVDACQAKHPEILEAIQARKWDKLLKAPGKANMTMIQELYANWNPATKGHLVWIRGVIVDISPAALCDYLGVDNHPKEPFQTFVRRPNYEDIRMALCGGNKLAKWKASTLRRHNWLPKRFFVKTAKVWHLFLTTRLMPCTHLSDVTRERVCLLYFLMKGEPINVGAIMIGEMRRTRLQTHRRLFFANTLTKFLYAKGVPEYDGDHIERASFTKFDITNVKIQEDAKPFKVPIADKDALMVRLLARTHMMQEKCCKALNIDVKDCFEKYPMSGLEKVLLGHESGSEVHSSEDENTDVELPQTLDIADDSEDDSDYVPEEQPDPSESSEDDLSDFTVADDDVGAVADDESDRDADMDETGTTDGVDDELEA